MEMSHPARGNDREKNLKRERYFSDSYFSISQLCSFAHQINYIWSMRPSSVIEIGLGNGFVSTFLKRAGIHVTTVDINPALEPDICAPLSDVHKLIPEQTDLVVCCEVLEHMPIEELDANLDRLRGLGKRLFLTLPNYRRTWGLSGLVFLPKLGVKVFDVCFDIPWKRRPPREHFWEVGYNHQCKRQEIVRRLKARYPSVRCGRFALYPHHIYFICE
jgi:SAM-dependent methyltransferase